MVLHHHHCWRRWKERRGRRGGEEGKERRRGKEGEEERRRRGEEERRRGGEEEGNDGRREKKEEERRGEEGGEEGGRGGEEGGGRDGRIGGSEDKTPGTANKNNEPSPTLCHLSEAPQPPVKENRIQQHNVTRSNFLLGNDCTKYLPSLAHCFCTAASLFPCSVTLSAPAACRLVVAGYECVFACRDV